MSANGPDRGTSSDRQPEGTQSVSPLLDDGEAYFERWREIQAGFVDDPRKSVGDADSLVEEVMQRLAEQFARERAGLESGWSDGDDDTEQLRRSLQHYRSFFTRLLST